MLDFHKRGRQPVSLSPKRQRKLLLLVLGVGVGLLVLVRGAHWIEILQSLEQRPAAATDAVDNRVAALQSAEQNQSVGMAAAPREPATADTAVPYFPGVKAELLDAVRDDRPWRRDEEPAWYNLLGVLAKTAPADLRRASTGPVSYVQLFKQAAEYRGHVVTLLGTAVRAEFQELPANPLQLKGYYQVWLKPQDNPTVPLMACVLELPAGFPTGQELAEPVALTGFFFKRWAYEAQDTLRSTPMLVARSVQWTPRPAEEPHPPRDTSISLVLVLGGAAMVLLWLAVAVWSRRRPAAVRRLPERIDVPPTDEA